MSTPTLDRSRIPAPGPLRPYHFPRVDRRTLSNGLSVLVAEQRNFPIATFDLVLPAAGGSADRNESAGLAALTASLLESGAGERDADELAEAVDDLGLSLDAGLTWDTTQVGFTALRSRAAEGFGLLADVVRRPTFPADEVERLRVERVASVTQRRGTPSSLAEEVASRYVFAPGVDYARPLTGLARTLEGLGRAQVEAFHAAHYRPESAALVAAGDVTADEVAELAERWLGDWTGAPPPLNVPEVRPGVERTTIVIAHRPGAVQSEIRVSHVGIERAAPDFFAVSVLNSVLGGVFASRLNLNLRERLGYTYGVSSSFASRKRPGIFAITTAVQTETTAHSVSEMLREMREIREAPVSDAELADSRNYLAGVFPLGVQTTDGVSGKLATIFTYGLPDDYYAHYREGIRGVTADEVLEAARRRLWPDRAAVVIAGDADAIRGPLEALDIGPVEVVDPATLG
jgi:zinc protease